MLTSHEYGIHISILKGIREKQVGKNGVNVLYKHSFTQQIADQV